MLAVVKSNRALDDLAEIWEYIALANPISANPVAADDVLHAVDQTLADLSEFPHRKAIPGRNLFITPVNQFPRYLLLYQFDEEVLQVLRIFACDLDWTRIIQEEP